MAPQPHTELVLEVMMQPNVPSGLSEPVKKMYLATLTHPLVVPVLLVRTVSHTPIHKIRWEHPRPHAASVWSGIYGQDTAFLPTRGTGERGQCLGREILEHCCGREAPSRNLC